MSITLSHQSALYALRQLRAEGVELRFEVDHTALARPSTWLGKRWTKREFEHESWHWQRPSKDRPLHVLVPPGNTRVRMSDVITHQSTAQLPASSIIWLNDVARMASPALMFTQMASVLPLPELVLLGYELCGGFTRSAENPMGGAVADHLSPATSVAELTDFLNMVNGTKGARRAREALMYMADGAISVPESVLATIYSLPPEESGYGMGPVELNVGYEVPRAGEPALTHKRYPDLMLGFAPVGINYDGRDHLNLALIEEAVRCESLADAEHLEGARQAVRDRHDEVRHKYVDDMWRNREFLARGKIVLPMVKEDLYGRDSLDNFTRLLLMCVRNFCGVDTSSFESQLEDADLRRSRYALLNRLLTADTSRER